MKTLFWVVSSKGDLEAFPLTVRKEMGHALYVAQCGDKHRSAKPLKGFGGATVLEIVVNDESGTFRTMYTVQFEKAVFVLHAFQKKSKSGIKTPQKEMELVEKRLRIAEQKYKEWLKTK